MKPPPAQHPYWRFQRQLARLNRAVFRRSRGRWGGTYRGAPVLLLDHVGRRSGEARTSPLIYLDDAPDLVVVASKGGTDTHPAWFHNLMAASTTRVELPGGVRRTVRPRVAEGAERDALWRRMVAVYPPYEAYQGHTRRRIPVVVLEPA
jgi:F420H(2)-dependent quinone reductase